ncbi:MAG: hypothetical protein PHY66_08265 [Aliarcobacter sp.]|nr:hypothetical protein [Aliarcobacter sp.]MDD2887784.1 hypothetical protein [Aliarcobacter sp.]
MDSLMALLTIFVILFFISKKYRSYLDIPTLDEYIKDNPHCFTGNGIKCFNCGSKSIRNWGQYGPNSSYRVHICNHCGLHLYRS